MSESEIISPQPPGQDMQAHFLILPLSTETMVPGSIEARSGNISSRLT
ncbi:hypothetical protein [Sphingopyxis sp. BSNA05]|nr:hypothetical protein [Sphingopyxis sp. BSNA05]